MYVWERETVHSDGRRDSCSLTTGNAVSSTSNLGISSWSLMRSEGQSPNNLIQKKETVELQSQQHSACQICTHKYNIIKAKTDQKAETCKCNASHLREECGEGNSFFPSTPPHPIPQIHIFLSSFQFIFEAIIASHTRMNRSQRIYCMGSQRWKWMGLGGLALGHKHIC